MGLWPATWSGWPQFQILVQLRAAPRSSTEPGACSPLPPLWASSDGGITVDRRIRGPNKQVQKHVKHLCL